MPSREEVIAWRDSICDGCIIEPEVSRFVFSHCPPRWVWENKTMTADRGREICDMWLEMNPESSGEALRRAIREARDGLNC